MTWMCLSCNVVIPPSCMRVCVHSFVTLCVKVCCGRVAEGVYGRGALVGSARVRGERHAEGIPFAWPCRAYSVHQRRIRAWFFSTGLRDGNRSPEGPPHVRVPSWERIPDVPSISEYSGNRILRLLALSPRHLVDTSFSPPSFMCCWSLLKE